MTFTVRRLREEEKKPRRSWKPLLYALLKASGPLMTIGHMWREKQKARKEERERVNVLKRIIVVLTTVLCAFLLFAATTKALISLNIVTMGNIVDIAGVDLPVDAYGHTNILLLGQGDAAHDGVDLTDTIMIASLDPANTKSAVLLSLPRDLYFMETQNMGAGRINSLYRDYKVILKRDGQTDAVASELAMKELAKEIGNATDIDIHHVLKVDFIGFVQSVDAIGGIDIVVPETLTDTEYPGPNYTYETFEIAAGPQHIDGETALKYARSRHSTSDFDRSRRQQQILQAIADKMQDEGILTKPGQIIELLDILSEHVATTLQVREMVSLAGAGKNIDRDHIITMQLNSENGLYGLLSSPGGLLYNPPRDQFNGASVLLPVSIPEFPVTWTQIKTLTSLLVHLRTPYVEYAPILILNNGAPEGSGRRIAGELIRYNFNVAAIENSEEEEEYPSSIITGSADSETAKLLSTLLGYELRTLPALTPSSETSQPQPSQPVTITLGQDFEYTPLQEAILSSFPLSE